MFDAIFAASRTATAGDNKGKRPLHHRHALFVERQQLMQRDRQIVKVGNKGSIRVDDNLPLLVAPGQTHDRGIG